MKKQTQSNSNAGQSNTEVKKSQKHDVNLQKNTTLYFQIGLILCLLSTFALFEMKFDSKTYALVETDQVIQEIYEVAMPSVQEYVPEAKPQPKNDIPKKIIDEVIEVKNDHKDIKQNVITQEQNITSEPKEAYKPEDIIKVEDAPLDG